MLKGILKQSKRFEQKLDKARIRMKNLEGDSLMLSASILLLGSIRFEERILIRKELAERLLTKTNIECSGCWSISDNEQMHSKYFLRVIKQDLNVSTELLTKINHLVIESVYAEFLFFLIFSNRTPIIMDVTGIHLDLLMNHVFHNSNFKVISAADYSISDKFKDLAVNS
jgi:hypothetical protein